MREADVGFNEGEAAIYALLNCLGRIVLWPDGVEFRGNGFLVPSNYKADKES